MRGEIYGEEKIVGSLSSLKVVEEKALRNTEGESLESFEGTQKSKGLMEAKRGVFQNAVNDQ